MAGVLENIKNTVVENLGGGVKLASAKDQFTLDDIPSQAGKCAVITGGSEGIGYGVTHTLLSKGIEKVFILSLSKEVVEGAKKAIAEELGQDKADRTEWIRCDMADWAAVAAVADQIAKSTDRLDILVGNAARGIMTAQLTDYGVDRHMATNVMGHVILTSHLLPLLEKTASQGHKVRLSYQSSNAHQFAPKDLKFESLEEINEDRGPNTQYGVAKLGAILYAKYLNKHITSKHPNILANSTHPGFVKTKMSEEDILEPFPLGGYLMRDVMAPFKKDQFEGALPTLYAVTATEKSGRYFCPPAVDEPGSPLANDEQLAENMMALCTKLIAEKTKSLSVDRGCPMKTE